MIPDIPSEVQQFVMKYITSLHQLELLLLVSALPDHEWSVEAVYKVVLSNMALVEEQLEGFVRSGLLSRSSTPPLYRYAPETTEIGNQIATLSALYKTSRHRIVELIYRQPPNPLRSFSDAFKLKRDK